MASSSDSAGLLLSMDDFTGYKQIGKGKDCVVYSATCDKLGGATVVLKVYDKSRISTIKHRSVRREARIMRFLTEKGTPHTTAYTGAFQDSKQIYIVMEHCSGGDLLEQLLREGRAMAEKRVVRDVVLPTLTALAHLHAAGIIHRDIKLENLFISSAGRLQLGDFGLAISTAEERPISPVGTLEYMSPEILRLPPTDSVVRGLVRVEDIAPVDEKVDLWSFGVTVYELVTGRSPFEGGCKDEVKAAILAHKMRPLPGFLTPGCQDFVLKCLSPRPADRPGALALLSHPWVVANCTSADLLAVASLPSQLPRLPMGHKQQQQTQQVQEQPLQPQQPQPSSSSDALSVTPGQGHKGGGSSSSDSSSSSSSSISTAVVLAGAAAAGGKAAGPAGKQPQGASSPSTPGSPQIPAAWTPSGNAAGTGGKAASSGAAPATPHVHDLPNSNSSGSSGSTRSGVSASAASMADSAASLYQQPAVGAAADCSTGARKAAVQEPISERPADESAAAAGGSSAGGASTQSHQQAGSRAADASKRPPQNKLLRWICVGAGMASGPSSP